MSKISIVVPCYNEMAVLNLFYETLKKEVKSIDADIEILFVDDGSHDNTLDIIKKLVQQDASVRYISFSRNFGKEAAIYAGLENASGEYVVIMDADLQDPPKLLPEMYQAVRYGRCDCVGTRRVTRKGEPPIRSFFARMFYKLINKMVDVQIVDGSRDYQMMSRKVVDSILSIKEYNRFSKGIFGWIGFKKEWIEYENIERAAGETKWNFGKLFLYAIEGIIAFSTKPLIASSVMGILCCLFAFAMIIFIMIKTLILGDPTSGWPSLVCIIFFLHGFEFLFIGILGEYLSRTYLETKQRPIYILNETNVRK